MQRRAFVGLGSNLAEPAERLQEAVERLTAVAGTRLLACSRYYRSPPWGPVTQPDFLNAVAELASVLPAVDLLAELLEVERAMGRQRLQRWGPRVIDLDLLDIEGEVTASHAALTLPHPRLHERAFVLLPWAEIAGDYRVGGRVSVAELLSRVDCSGVSPVTLAPLLPPGPP